MRAKMTGEARTWAQLKNNAHHPMAGVRVRGRLRVRGRVRVRGR